MPFVPGHGPDLSADIKRLEHIGRGEAVGDVFASTEGEIVGIDVQRHLEALKPTEREAFARDLGQKVVYFGRMTPEAAQQRVAVLRELMSASALVEECSVTTSNDEIEPFQPVQLGKLIPSYPFERVNSPFALNPNAIPLDAWRRDFSDETTNTKGMFEAHTRDTNPKVTVWFEKPPGLPPVERYLDTPFDALAEIMKDKNYLAAFIHLALFSAQAEAAKKGIEKGIPAEAADMRSF